MKFDGRTKIILAMALSTTAIVLNNPVKLSIILAASFVVVRLMGVNPLSGIRRYRELFWLFVAMAILQNFLAPQGKPILKVLGHNVLFETSLLNAVSIVIRVTVIFVTGYLLISLGEKEFIKNMRFFKVPETVLLMTVIGLRFIPIVRNRIIDMMNSVKLKGLDPDDMKIMERARFYLKMSIPLVFSTLKKARDIAAILEARGFGSRNKTRHHFNSLKTHDWLLICTVTVIIAIIFAT